MFNWFNCYLSGRHEFGVACEPGAIFLRCLHCGRRSCGLVARRESAARRARAVTRGDDVLGRHRCRDRTGARPRAAPSAAPYRNEASSLLPIARPAARLTLRARADHNTSVAVPRISKEDLKSSSSRPGLTRPHRRPAEISVRAQHHAPAGRDSLHRRSAPRCRATATIVVYDSDPERARELARRRRADPPGLPGGGAQRRHRRVARGETADRNQRTRRNRRPPEPGALKG